MNQKEEFYLRIIKFSAYPTLYSLSENEKVDWEKQRKSNDFTKENQNFDFIKKIIEKNPAYQDKSANVTINVHELFQSFSLKEILPKAPESNNLLCLISGTALITTAILLMIFQPQLGLLGFLCLEIGCGLLAIGGADLLNKEKNLFMKMTSSNGQ